MAAYYNEIDTYAAEWLRRLIKQGHIADGVVDTRSISEVEPNDIRDFTQCHFFAGIGVWSHALRSARWPDERPVWTGSCPCQPFSVAGRAAGFDDERHLWPHWHHLIRECRPRVVFGEQVASKDGLTWLDLVHSDLEGEGYAFSAFDLCAAGVGAPHIRQRLYFVADAGSQRCQREQVRLRQDERGRDAPSLFEIAGGSAVDQLADHSRSGWREKQSNGRGRSEGIGEGQTVVRSGRGNAGELGDAQHTRLERHAGAGDQAQGRSESAGSSVSAIQPCDTGPTNGHWGIADWLFCRDGKWRPVEPGTFPLANGAPARVGRLRAYGNAIVPQVATALIGAYMDATD